MSLSAFPKIWHLGTPQTERLFNGHVEVTEKLDGSQVAWTTNEDGELFMRSKGAMLQEDTQDKLFKPVVDWIVNLHKSGQTPLGCSFWGETFCKPKHNILAYERIPKNHFALFGCRDPFGNYMDHYRLQQTAEQLGCDVVPKIYEGLFGDDNILERIKSWLGMESYLGGTRIEGVVIKNYNEQLLIGGQFIPILAGKYVSEAFKEQHKRDWVTSGDIIRDMQLSFKTPARWNKAIQHLREKGELTHSPKDIGALLKELHVDFEEECKDQVKDMLWNYYRKDFLKTLTGGFPEYYKQFLVENQVVGGSA